MVKLKGAGGGGSVPQASGELSHVEFDLQVHKDETAARFSELQMTLNVYQESLNSFRTELMKELQTVKDNSAVAAAQINSSLLKFGSLPPTSGSPILVAREDSSSSTRALTTANGSISKPASASPLNLVGNNVALDTTCGTTTAMVDLSSEVNTTRVLVTNASGAIILQAISTGSAEERDLSRQKQQCSEAQNQTHYYQHTILGPQPLDQFLGPYSASSSNHVHAAPYFGNQNLSMSSADPFTMSYSGPYSHTLLNFAQATPPPLQKFSAQPMGTARPIFATTITQTPQFNVIGNVQNHSGPPYSQQQYTLFPPPQYFQQSPVTTWDPNLPTMKQMKLEFSVFSGGDPVEWLNKTEQFFEFYHIPEERKLAIATMHLTEKASDRWFMFKHEFPNSWPG
ncbi:hypothetical protein RchiOBHm_Chr4g0414861 [Rosa chinensis]|uniref:Retrotransposon gag domain-containing protein n=1 Tax=Rosa chinensis TaxID=74649 RepID=A0A2P6QWK2_ROSCH|nr:uncharacterized protein LOC121052950 [Rosa chinensis]PRQ38519.1 hypothetical protein RchiOBHm_Chr4g0414861 [Rosa chinensis]